MSILNGSVCITKSKWQHQFDLGLRMQGKNSALFFYWLLADSAESILTCFNANSSCNWRLRVSVCRDQIPRAPAWVVLLHGPNISEAEGCILNHLDILVSWTVASFQYRRRNVSVCLMWPMRTQCAPPWRHRTSGKIILQKMRPASWPASWLFGIKSCGFNKVPIVWTCLDRKTSTLHMKPLFWPLGPGYTRPARVHQRKTQDPKRGN